MREQLPAESPNTWAKPITMRITHAAAGRESRLPHHRIISRSSSGGRMRRCWSWDRGSGAEALTGLSKNVPCLTYPHTSSWTSRTHIPSGIHSGRIQVNYGTAGPHHIYEHRSDTRPHLRQTYQHKKKSAASSTTGNCLLSCLNAAFLWKFENYILDSVS